VILRDHEGGLHDHGGSRNEGGLHPKSETADQASTAPRQLIIEWITRL
jgi:hypothetical protein